MRQGAGEQGRARGVDGQGRWRRRRGGLAALLAAGLWLGGCGVRPHGQFVFQKLAPQAGTLQQELTAAYCAYDERGQVQVVLAARDPVRQGGGDVRQMLVIRSFWLPKGPQTPRSASATNANLEYVVEANGQVGWYRGAGFAEVKRSGSRGDVRVTLRSAHLRLQGKTADFAETFTLAELTGSAEAVHKPAAVEELLARLAEYRKRLPQP